MLPNLTIPIQLTEIDQAEFERALLEAEVPYQDINAMTDEEMEAEVARRIAEAERDPSVLIPWEVVKKFQ